MTDGMNDHPHTDGFGPASREALAGLLLWAAHFGATYVFIAASCVSPLREMAWAGVPVIRLGLLAMTLPLLAWLVWRALSGMRHAGGGGSLLRMARIGSSVLAAVAVGWTLLPMFVLPVCGAM